LETSELLEIISRGEDSKHQLKANFTNVNSLAVELVAFSNSGGGTLFIGVCENGSFAGLTREDMGRLNQLLSHAASQSVGPPINPPSEDIATRDGLVMVVHVPQGENKPYMDNIGGLWVKCGSDKRRATSREEMQRMYQSAGLIHGDEIPADNLTVADLDRSSVFCSFGIQKFPPYIPSAFSLSTRVPLRGWAFPR